MGSGNREVGRRITWVVGTWSWEEALQGKVGTGNWEEGLHGK